MGMVQGEISKELGIRHVVNQLENVAYEALWDNPDNYDRFIELICPLIKTLHGLAQTGATACPPGTVECSDGVCRVCCRTGPGPDPLKRPRVAS